jgi:hypothetical protein
MGKILAFSSSDSDEAKGSNSFYSSAFAIPSSSPSYFSGSTFLRILFGFPVIKPLSLL